MSISRQIAPSLPYLRRFARALSGSQASGDAYVVSALEALVADPSIFPKNLPARLALYRIFLNLWSRAGVNDLAETPVTAAERNLNAIAPRPRQAFLLRTVEEFTIEETAQILDVNVKEAENLIEEAGKEIARQVATKVMIIEDEPIIALDLESLVEDLGHTVTGIARTHREALALIEQDKPGLILADIQLADGSSGLDAVNEILQMINIPVIFITAYPNRFLTGEKPEPAFLIAKPFQHDNVRATISQALYFDQKAGGGKVRPHA